MPKKTKSQRTVSPKVAANLKKIQPPVLGMRNVGRSLGMKLIGSAAKIPKYVAVKGQKKIKVNNPLGATQVSKIRRRPRFRVTK